MAKPHFGVTTDPDEKPEVKETPKVPETKQTVGPKFGVSDEAPAETEPPIVQQPKPTKLKAADKVPIFGAGSNQKKATQTSILAIFKLRPWWFWLKAFAISFVGLFVTALIMSDHFVPTTWYAWLPVNLVLFPFASAMMEEIGQNINLPVPTLTYIIFGSTNQLGGESTGCCLAVPLMLGLRFVAFVIEWIASVLLGIISLIVMYNQVKR